MSIENKPTSNQEVNIKKRLLLETTSALGAAFIVTPIIKIVDVSVTTGQSGKASTLGTAKTYFTSLITTPHKFFLSKYFGWIYYVYFSTYTANNCIDSLCKIYKVNDVIPKLFGVTAVNMFVSITKDAAFAKYFGTKPPSRIPLLTYMIWFVRDMLSIASAFILPERLSKVLQKRGQVKSKSDVYSQFSVPIGMQVILLPIHLLGLDIYNNNQSALGERGKRIFKNYLPSLPLRFLRMASAYGIGGISNKSFRSQLIKKYENRVL